MPSYTIKYLFLLPSPDIQRFTPIQGFDIALLRRSWITKWILEFLPPTIIELYRGDIKILQMRLAGLAVYNIMPLAMTELMHLKIDPAEPFWVIFTDAETREPVQDWLKSLRIPVLVIDIKSGPQSVIDLSRSVLTSHCTSVIECIRRDHPEYYFEEYDRFIHEEIGSSPQSPELDIYNHNTTVPNELALLSIGFQQRRILPRLEGVDALYVSAIVRSFNEVMSIRDAVPATSLFRLYPHVESIILTSPGVYFHMRKVRRPKGRAHDPFYTMLRYIQAQQTYAFQIPDEEGPQLERVKASEEGKWLIFSRTQEAMTYTAALAVRAASFLCPVIRLPPKIDHVMPTVQRLGDAIRARKPKLEKLRAAANAVFDQLSAAVDPQLMQLIDREQRHVKIVSDAPLEWLPVRELPIALRYSTSRVPVTPGNFSYAQILPQQSSLISIQDFKEILIVRSFRDNDPIRLDVERAVRAHRLRDGEILPVRIVDVRNRTEFIQAFETFSGALAIYDGHGTHQNGDTIGSLQLADEDLNVWDIRQSVNLPPIIFACACDTHAVNRNHVSVGNGFLFCDVRAVIASLLPLESEPAARFLVSLLSQLYEWLRSRSAELPLAKRWDAIFSQAIRIEFIKELVTSIAKRLGVEVSSYQSCLAKCVEIIEHQDDGWFEQSLTAISKHTGLTESQLELIRLEVLPFPEVLKYVHLGNPETLVLYRSEITHLNGDN